MYIYASSEESRKWFLPPSGSSFTITLPKHLDCSGEWECCLKELRLDRDKNLEGLFYICSDIVQASIVCGTETSMLRGFDLVAKTAANDCKDICIFDNSYYLPINKGSLGRINISIKDALLGVTGGFREVHCLLHLRKVK